MNAATENKSRVLIVDDEPGNIKILSNVLAGDYALSVATSGAQALKVAQVQLPDIVLLDMVMPEMDGIDVCQALKASENTRDIPVIFVTSMSDSMNEERGLDAGAVDYISKPYHQLEFLRKVREMLDRSYQAEEKQNLHLMN